MELRARQDGNRVEGVDDVGSRLAVADAVPTDRRFGGESPSGPIVEQDVEKCCDLVLRELDAQARVAAESEAEVGLALPTEVQGVRI